MKYYNTVKEINGFDNDEVVTIAGSSIKDDLTAIGAEVGEGFTNTQKLHVMKCKETMKTKDKEK